MFRIPVLRSLFGLSHKRALDLLYENYFALRQSTAGIASHMNVAVVIPVFNKERYVERAIRSTLGQTLSPSKIFVVDDASTDGSREKIASLADPTITILRRATPGPGGYAARNLAIEAASTEWIAFLDADDEWAPEHLQSIADAISRNGDDPTIGCVFTGYREMYQDGYATSDPYTRKIGRAQDRRWEFVHFLDVWSQVRACPVLTSAAAFRRRVLLEAGLFPAGRCARGGDKDLWLRVARHTDLLACPSVTTMYYRDAANKVTRNNTANLRHCLCDTIDRLIAEETSSERRRVLKRLFNSEVFQYAKVALRTQRVDPQVWKGFHVAQDPLRFLVLQALSRLPHSLTRRLVRSRRRAK
jgi:succinoglycan biosynthesis protein ExoO